MARGGALALSPVCAYVAERTGSSLSEQQVARLRDLLIARMKDADEARFVGWLKTVEGAATLAELMAAIAVHKTDLFRDEVQLDAFSRHVLKPLVQQHKRPLHLWSAGCATGEEVATLLILLHEAGAHPQSTVLGTDISEHALKQARTFTFHPEIFRRVPAPFRKRYFVEEKHGHARLIPELAQQAQFQRHNLMDLPYPLSPLGSAFDVVFCRNVLIYFTDAAFERTVDGLADRLHAHGTMVLSAAEPLLKPRANLMTVRYDQAFFYRKWDGREAKPMQSPLSLARPLPELVLPRPVETPAAVVAPAYIARTLSGEQALQSVPPTDDPREEAAALFALVLDWAAAGEEDADTEQGLRRCLYLDPHLAQARYLLGMLLEQKGARPDAAAEYRRALSALNEGRSRSTAFFLNDERLKTACARALERLGYPR
ncbi:MAG: CheR family methyltransferase [Myxococcaceae bacterium]